MALRSKAEGIGDGGGLVRRMFGDTRAFSGEPGYPLAETSTRIANAASAPYIKRCPSCSGDVGGVAAQLTVIAGKLREGLPSAADHRIVDLALRRPGQVAQVGRQR